MRTDWSGGQGCPWSRLQLVAPLLGGVLMFNCSSATGGARHIARSFARMAAANSDANVGATIPGRETVWIRSAVMRPLKTSKLIQTAVRSYGCRAAPANSLAPAQLQMAGVRSCRSRYWFDLFWVRGANTTHSSQIRPAGPREARLALTLGEPTIRWLRQRRRARLPGTLDIDPGGSQSRLRGAGRGRSLPRRFATKATLHPNS